MPNFIPIQIVVDGQQILDSCGHGGTLRTPISLQSIQEDCVFMITNNAFVSSKQAQAELAVNAKPGDFLHWRIAAVDRTDYNPILVKFEADHPDALKPPKQAIVQMPYYLPKSPSNPDSGVKMVAVDDVQMESEVLKGGETVHYDWVFKLVNRSGQTMGFYSWNPAILVS